MKEKLINNDIDYYFTRPSLRQEIIGKGEALLYYPKEYDLDDPNSLFRINRNFYKPLNIQPNITDLILDEEGKLNDFTWNPSNQIQALLVSERALMLIENYLIQSSNILPINIIDKQSKKYKYFWIHFNEDLKEYVDYKNSSFYIMCLSEWIEPIEINSIEDYEFKYKKIREKDITFLIKAKKLEFFDDIYKYHLFSISRFSLPYLYISRALKNEIEKMNLTGLDFWTLDGEPLF